MPFHRGYCCVKKTLSFHVFSTNVWVNDKLWFVFSSFVLAVSRYQWFLMLRHSMEHLLLGGEGGVGQLTLKSAVRLFVQLPISSSKNKMKMKLTFFSVCWSFPVMLSNTQWVIQINPSVLLRAFSTDANIKHLKCTIRQPASTPKHASLPCAILAHTSSISCLIVIHCPLFEEPRHLVRYWFYLQGLYILLCAKQSSCFQVHAWINVSPEPALATACGSIPPIYVLITMIY